MCHLPLTVKGLIKITKQKIAERKIPPERLITMLTLSNFPRQPTFLVTAQQKPALSVVTTPHVACTRSPGAESSALTLNYLEIPPTVLHLFSPSVQTIRSDQAARQALTCSPSALLGC